MQPSEQINIEQAQGGYSSLIPRDVITLAANSLGFGHEQAAAAAPENAQYASVSQNHDSIALAEKAASEQTAQTALELQKEAYKAQVKAQMSALQQQLDNLPNHEQANDAQAQLLKAQIDGLDALIAQIDGASSFADLSAIVSESLQGALDRAQGTGSDIKAAATVESGVLLAEKFQSYSAEFQQAVVRFESWHQNWNQAQEKNYQVVSELAQQYDVNLDETNEKRAQLKAQIEQETDPVKKALLVQELAQTDLEAAENVEQGVIKQDGPAEDIEKAKDAKELAQRQLEEATAEAERLQQAAAKEAEQKLEKQQEQLRFARDAAMVAEATGDPTQRAQARAQYAAAQQDVELAAVGLENINAVGDELRQRREQLAERESTRSERETQIMVDSGVVGLAVVEHNRQEDKRVARTDSAVLTVPNQSYVSPEELASLSGLAPAPSQSFAGLSPKNALAVSEITLASLGRIDNPQDAPMEELGQKAPKSAGSAAQEASGPNIA